MYNVIKVTLIEGHVNHKFAKVITGFKDLKEAKNWIAEDLDLVEYLEELEGSEETDIDCLYDIDPDEYFIYDTESEISCEYFNVNTDIVEFFEVDLTDKSA